MQLISSLHQTVGAGHPSGALVTLAVALFLAAIYLCGGRASRILGESGLRRFHSFAAGSAMSYVFVYIMPELHAIRETHLITQDDYIKRIFPGYSVYLSALLGFLIFYGLESMTAQSRRKEGRGAKPWMHICAFAIYTWLITFQIGRSCGGVVSMGVFALAMGLHLAPVANRLRHDYPAVYEHRGAILLAAASIAGWACGLTLPLPDPLVLDMTAIVAGGVIVNAAIAELPKEREASFGSFLAGAVAYTALLLALSHYQEGIHP